MNCFLVQHRPRGSKENHQFKTFPYYEEDYFEAHASMTIWILDNLNVYTDEIVVWMGDYIDGQPKNLEALLESAVIEEGVLAGLVDIYNFSG